MQRLDQRAQDALRPITITPNFVSSASGSCLIEAGGTRVICTASVEEGVPPFLRGKGEGWLTAEYAMLPASTGRRKQRDGLKKDGRGVEISRLIGRVLRQAVDRSRLGERTITIDCDVLEADGGTRTAAITGGYVALCLAVQKLLSDGRLKESPVIRQIAAVSCGVVEGEALLDLCYQEDSQAQADMNVVLDESGAYIELQGTGEGRPFTAQELATLLNYAGKGISELMACQRAGLGDAYQVIGQKQKLVLASNNAHKIKELRHMLGDRFDILSMAEAGYEGDIDENGSTFEANAIIKAEAVRDFTGLLSLADDSGLMVDALEGAPGVNSARYAGRHGDDAANNEKLLYLMEEIEEGERGAQFVSVLALASPFTKTLTFRGECPGKILYETRGQGGFGYDPLFEYETGKTFAEMTQEEKDAVSHRARAMAKLRDYLK